jgi:hypothetical protein
MFFRFLMIFKLMISWFSHFRYLKNGWSKKKYVHTCPHNIDHNSSNGGLRFLWGLTVSNFWFITIFNLMISWFSPFRWYLKNVSQKKHLIIHEEWKEKKIELRDIKITTKSSVTPAARLDIWKNLSIWFFMVNPTKMTNKKSRTTLISFWAKVECSKLTEWKLVHYRVYIFRAPYLYHNVRFSIFVFGKYWWTTSLMKYWFLKLVWSWWGVILQKI